MSSEQIQATEPITTEPINGEQEQQTKPEKKKREKHVYMLHDPETFASKGRFIATGPRFAAQKAASRGFKKIYLRKTNTKKVYVYNGDIVTLDEPHVIQRGDQTITYRRKSVVKAAQKPFIYDGNIPNDDETAKDLPENPKASTV